ncbi:AraC family transcriptional regulator [Breznakiella homolactica]|uniref:AraC family transcriptional regulator n=1 Tax=Breznakiella homolactica TaxID=2798577 RepID=A0A7T8BA23_9SPIR|nr:AraC family transcriptional regulator [Breznakiella homolactica]QQO08540.1 AraC family transcriptional regulator [Breznakiella homolactica]
MEKQEYKYIFRNRFRTMASLSVYRTGYKQCTSEYSRGMEVRDFYILHFVISGRGTYSLNGKRFCVKAGESFLIYPNMQINYWADRNDPWEYCWVGFDGADARILMDTAGFSPERPVVRPSSPEKIHRRIMDIYKCRGQEVYKLISMTARLYTLLACLIEDAARNGPILSSHIGLTHVQQACDYIANNYSRHITVEDIASHANVSRSQLYRVFIKHISVSPLQYLREFRLREACTIMQQQPESIKNIAYAVGFENPLYFSTLFKGMTGETPTEYVSRYANKRK